VVRFAGSNPNQVTFFTPIKLLVTCYWYNVKIKWYFKHKYMFNWNIYKFKFPFLYYIAARFFILLVRPTIINWPNTLAFQLIYSYHSPPPPSRLARPRAFKLAMFSSVVITVFDVCLPFSLAASVATVVLATSQYGLWLQKFNWMFQHGRRRHKDSHGVVTLLTFFYEHGGSTKLHGVTSHAPLISLPIS
jgi:hypothetical protein